MSAMTLSPGDWIAVGIGSMASLRWCADLIGKWLTRNSEDAKADEKNLNLLRHDFDIHVAEDRRDFGWLKETLERMERQIGQMQSQIRFVASGGNDQVRELHKRSQS